MQMLQVALPKEVRPYSLKLSNSNAASQVVTSLILRGENTIVIGSRDCSVSLHGEQKETTLLCWEQRLVSIT